MYSLLPFNEHCERSRCWVSIWRVAHHSIKLVVVHKIVCWNDYGMRLAFTGSLAIGYCVPDKLWTYQKGMRYWSGCGIVTEHSAPQSAYGFYRLWTCDLMGAVITAHVIAVPGTECWHWWVMSCHVLNVDTGEWCRVMYWMSTLVTVVSDVMSRIECPAWHHSLVSIHSFIHSFIQNDISLGCCNLLFFHFTRKLRKIVLCEVYMWMLRLVHGNPTLLAVCHSIWHVKSGYFLPLWLAAVVSQVLNGACMTM